MSQNINLTDLEKKAYTSYHEDGLLDLFVGLWILFFGFLDLFTDKVWVAFMFPVWASPVWVLLKKKITVSRIGYAKFSRQRMSQMQRIFFSTAVLISLAALIVVLLRDYHRLPQWFVALLSDNTRLLFGIIVVLLFIAGAWTLNIRRFYAYSLLTFLLFACGDVLNLPGVLLMALLGMATMICGTAMLYRFFEKYPKSEAST